MPEKIYPTRDELGPRQGDDLPDKRRFEGVDPAEYEGNEARLRKEEAERKRREEFEKQKEEEEKQRRLKKTLEDIKVEELEEEPTPETKAPIEEPAKEGLFKKLLKRFRGK